MFDSQIALGVDPAVAAKLRSIANMPTHLRCFDRHFVYYIEDCFVKVIRFGESLKYADMLQFGLRQSKTPYTIDLIKVISFPQQQDLLFIALADQLFAYSLNANSLLFRKLWNSKKQSFLTLSNVYVRDGVVATLCGITKDYKAYLIQMERYDRLSQPKLTLLNPNNQSLFKSIVSLPGSIISMLSSGQQQNNTDLLKAFVLQESTASCLIVKDNHVVKYKVTKNNDDNRVSMQQSIRLPCHGQVKEVWVQYCRNLGPAVRLVFYVLSCNQSNYTLFRCYRTINLEKIATQPDESVEIFSQNMTPQLYEFQETYLMLNDNRSKMLVFSNFSPLEIKSNQKNVDGRAVIFQNYLITSRQLICLSQQEPEISFSQDQQKQITQPSRELTAAASVYDNFQKTPKQLVDALQYKMLRLQSMFNTNNPIKGEILLELILVKIQLLLLQHINRLKFILESVAQPIYPSKNARIFQTTHHMETILNFIAFSPQFLIYDQILKMLESQKNANPSQFQQIHKQIQEIVLRPLVEKCTKLQFQKQFYQILNKAIDLAPNQTIFYEQLLKIGRIPQCKAKALKYRHYQIGFQLYIANDVITAGEMRELISELNKEKREMFIRDLTEVYFEHLNRDSVKRIKIFQDFPQDNKLILDVVSTKKPQFAWLLAMKLGYPRQTYARWLPSMRHPLHANLMKMFSPTSRPIPQQPQSMVIEDC